MVSIGCLLFISGWRFWLLIVVVADWLIVLLVIYLRYYGWLMFIVVFVYVVIVLLWFAYGLGIVFLRVVCVFLVVDYLISGLSFRFWFRFRLVIAWLTSLLGCSIWWLVFIVACLLVVCFVWFVVWLDDYVLCCFRFILVETILLFTVICCCYGFALIMVLFTWCFCWRCLIALCFSIVV